MYYVLLKTTTTIIIIIIIIIIVPKNNKNPFSRKVNVINVRCQAHPEILRALCFI
jgi:hypothetical protein